MDAGTIVWATAAGLATGSTVLAVLVWLTERRFRAEAREVTRPTGGEAPSSGSAGRGAAADPMTSVRLVHVVADGEVVTIDALVDEAGAGQLGTTGTPVALRLRRADTPWFDETTCRLLERWADDCRVVQVVVRKRHPSAAGTATLRSGASMMKLSLLA